jgi:hypothetical protein
MPFEGGPYVQAACFCDMVVEDKAGVLSLIRVIDTLGTQQIGPNPPREMPPVAHAMKLVIMLKSGRAEGRHDMKIVPSLPNGETENAIDVSVAFEGDEKGQNLVADFQFIFFLFSGQSSPGIPQIRYARLEPASGSHGIHRAI